MLVVVGGVTTLSRSAEETAYRAKGHSHIACETRQRWPRPGTCNGNSQSSEKSCNQGFVPNMGQAGRYEGELDARKRARPVRWRGKALSSLDDMLIPLSFKWNHRCVYCDAHDVPLELDHIHPRSKHGTGRVSNLTLACHACNQRKGDQDIRAFLREEPERLARLLAQVKTPLRDAAAVNTIRWALYERLSALGLPVECGSGGGTKCNRMTRALPKAHWLDAACVGKSTPQVLKLRGIVPWKITATGHGSRQMCRMDRFGFPRTGSKQHKRVAGFQTGDLVRAVVSSGTKQGTYVGKVAVRSSGHFNITTRQGVVQGIAHRYCRLIARSDGYSHYLGKERAFPPAT